MRPRAVSCREGLGRQLWALREPSSLQIHRRRAVSEVSIPESCQSLLSTTCPMPSFSHRQLAVPFALSTFTLILNYENSEHATDKMERVTDSQADLAPNCEAEAQRQNTSLPYRNTPEHQPQPPPVTQ